MTLSPAMTSSPACLPMVVNTSSEAPRTATGPGQPQNAGQGQRRPASLLGRLRFLLHLLARQGMVVAAGAGIGSGAAVGALLLLPHQAAQAHDTTSKHVHIRFPPKQGSPVQESPFTILENVPLVPNRGTTPYDLEVIFSTEPSGPVRIVATVPAGLVLIRGVIKYREGEIFSKPYHYDTVGWESGHISLGLRVEAENNNTIGTNKNVPITFEFKGGGYEGVKETVTFIIKDDDELEVSTKSLEVREGASNSYNVQLSHRPNSPVVVNVGGASGGVTVSPAHLTFTTSNWDRKQTVTVKASNGGSADEVTLTHDVRIENDDSKSQHSVDVRVVRNPGVTISAENSLQVKAKESTTYTVKLKTQPAGDVTVTPSRNPAVKVSPPALTFTTSNYSTAQTVTVTGVAAGSATISHAVSGYGSVKTADSVTVKVIPSVPIPPVLIKAKPGDGEVILTWEPLNDPSITRWQIRYGKVGRRLYPQLPFGDASTTTKKVPTPDNGVEYSFSVRAKNKQGWGQWSGPKNATPQAISLMLSAENLEVREGDTSTYTVKLNIQPRGSVTVETKSKDKNIATVSPETLTFNRDNWNTPKTVTVNGLRDYVVTKQNKPVDVGHVMIDYYDRRTDADSVAVEVVNTDVAGVTISESTLTVTEAEGDRHSATYTVVLNTKPSRPVIIIPVEEKSKVDMSPRILNFDQSNWNIHQTVTITGRGDHPDANNENVTIKHYPHYYDSMTQESIQSVAVTVIDSSSVPAKPTSLSASPGDREVVLTWEAQSDLSITGWQVQQKKGAEDWPTDWGNIAGATTRTHTVTGLENGAEHHFRIRARNNAGESTPSDVATATPATPAAARRIRVPSPVRVLEGAGQTPVVVHFLDRPTNSVTVTMVKLLLPHDSNLSVADKQSKTLTPELWDSGKKSVEFPVSAPNDDVTNTSRRNVNLELSFSDNYSPARYVTVDIIDDEVENLVVTPGKLRLNEGESASYEVLLSKRPTADVTVNIGKPRDTDATLSASTLTFTTGNWKVRKTVTVTAKNDIETPSTLTLTHTANPNPSPSSGNYRDVSGGTVDVTLGGGGDSLSGSALTLAAEPDHQDAARAAKARGSELAGTSRALLGMASDRLGARLTGAAAMGGGDGGEASLGDQAWGVVENLLGINGSELPTDLDLEQMGERLWSQSFQISAGGGVAQAEGISSGGKGSWTLWGAGDLRSYRGDAEEHVSFSGSLKTGWLGLDHRFNHQWLAGLAVSHSSGESDYTYRKVSGATDGGKLSNQVTAFYPYGAVQLSERLRLWALAGFGFGSQQHQPNEGGEKAEGKLRTQMGVVGFTRQLNDVGALQLALAGDVALARSTTDWPSASGLQDVEVSLSRARLGVDTRFPLTEQATGYVNVKGRLDGGELEMGAAELLAGLHYNGGRFSGALQGQQVYAFDGSYGESGISAQLRFRSQPDGSGLAWEIQPSYGYDAGTFALGGEQVSLWSDEQLASLSGGGDGAEGGGEMELSSRLGYGIRLWDGDRLLTPFTELRLSDGGSRSVGLGLSLSTPSWEVELKGASEGGSGSAATGKVDLTFSRKL